MGVPLFPAGPKGFGGWRFWGGHSGNVPTPQMIAQVEFAEWTPDEHLRHKKFVALREDKNANGCREGSCDQK